MKHHPTTPAHTARKATALVVAVLAVTVLATGVAAAADRVDRVAVGLRQSPVFVDPDVSYLLDAGQRQALTRQIQAAGVPIYLAVVPLGSQDESAGNADYFTYLLHRRLGRNGIYLVSDERGGLDWAVYRIPRDDRLAYDQAFNDKPLPQKLHDVIDVFAHAPAAAPSDPPTPKAPEPDPAQKKTTAGGLAGEFATTFFPSLLFSGLLLAFVWSVGRAVTRPLRNRPVRDSPVRAAGRTRQQRPRGLRARNLKPRGLRRAAEAELVRLARAIGRAEPGNPGHPRAMADYDAAKLLFDEKDDPGSRFGVVVLALEGQDALRDETAEPRPRCLVDPFHGTAARRVRRRLPELSDARRPLCDVCERPTTRISPLTLEIDGRRRPYYAAPGLWEKIKGRTDDLPVRVLEYLGVE